MRGQDLLKNLALHKKHRNTHTDRQIWLCIKDVYVCANSQEQELKKQKELERQLEKQRQMEMEREEERRKAMEQREVCISRHTDVVVVIVVADRICTTPSQKKRCKAVEQREVFLSLHIVVSKVSNKNGV